MKDLTFDALGPGEVFTYYASRGGLLGRRRVAVGRVLAVDAATSSVIVRTLSETSEGDLEVDVGFMPISLAAFQSSVIELGGVGPLSNDFHPAMDLWRMRVGAGIAGSFVDSIAEAETLVWQTVREHEPESGPEAVYVEYAFPQRDAKGTFTRVLVSWLPRVQIEG